MRYKFNFLITYCLFFISFLSADIVRRAAIDIGSAETKIMIADVDTEANQIIHIHFQDYRLVELRKDLAASHDGMLSQEIVKRLLAVLTAYKGHMEELSCPSWFCFGTAVFRKAKNGEACLQRIRDESGISIYLASQMEEGEIGFMTAVSRSGLPKEDVIAWDSGSGSFQITTLDGEKMDMYGAEFGFVPSQEVLVKTIRGEVFDAEKSPNPIFLDELLQLSSIIQKEKLPPLPAWLLQTDKKIVAFGGPTSIFSIGQIATNKTRYTREEIFAAIQNLAGKSDEELIDFPEPNKVLIGLTLLHAVMNQCHFDEMAIVKTNGGCEGVLIMPQLWKMPR